jgi:tetratricopeptide (TPR) repeat protein
MPKRSTVLKELLRERHWQTYATFCRRYDDAARSIDPVLVGRWPSRGQFARWLSGDLKGYPHPDHCRVLEAMFTGRSVGELFQDTSGPDPDGGGSQRHEGGHDRTTHAGVTVLPRHTGAPTHTEAPAHTGVPVARRAPTLSGPVELPEHPRLRSLDRAPEPPRDEHPEQHPGQHPGHHPGPVVRSVDLTVPPDATRPITHGIPVPAGPPDLSLWYASGAVAPVQPEEITLATEQSAGFVRGAQGGITHDTLDQLAADVRQLAAEYLVKPPLTVFRPLARLRTEVFEMLDRRQRPSLLPPLYSVAGRLCALLAHASADLGHAYAADTHTRTAWMCADLADDDSLRAYVRWVQANVAFWAGDFHQAARIAHSGQRFATKGSNLLRLASQEARAWAACGETAEVERTLALAASARHAASADDQAGVFRFDAGKAAYYASEIRLAMGGRANALLAIDEAHEALRIFDAGPEAQRSPEFVAAARLDLANTHLALADLDSAARELRTVLHLPVECRTQPIVGRMTRAATTLRLPEYAGSGLAVELGEEIALFRARPAQRDLPTVDD